MAIDPRLVSIKKVTDIPTVPLSDLQTGQMFGYTGDGDLKKVATNDLLGFIKSGIKGIATQANAPTAYTPEAYPNGLFETYVVRNPLTMPNSWGSAVTQAELDANYVFFDVRNGVITRSLSLKPGVDMSVVENYVKNNKSILVTDVKSSIDITGNIIDDSYWNGSGNIASFIGAKRTEKLKVNINDEIWVQTLWTSVLFIAFFDSAGVFISTRTHTGGVLTKITLPTGTSFIGVSGQDANPIKVERRNIDVLPAITKANELTENSLLKNIPFIDGSYFHATTGVIASLAGFQRTEKTAIKQGENLVLNGTLDIVANGSAIVFFDASDTFIPYPRKTNYINEYIVPPANATSYGVSKRSTDTLTVKKAGISEVVATNYPTTRNNAENGSITARASNFYQLGEDYQTLKTRKAAENYGLVFAGQSNAVGQSVYGDLATLGLPTSLAVSNWNGAVLNNPYVINSGETWGVWWSVLKRLKDYLPTKPIYYYNYSSGGTSLFADWNVQNLGTRSKIFADRAYGFKQLSPTINIKAIVWIQGENDITPPNDANYYENLKNFVEFARGVIGNPIVPFIIVGHHKNSSRYNRLIREAQIRVANEGYSIYFINPDSLTWTSVGDNLHYDGAYNELLAPLIFNVIKDL